METVVKQPFARPPVALVVSQGLLLVAAVAAVALVGWVWAPAAPEFLLKAALVAAAAQVCLSVIDRSRGRRARGGALGWVTPPACATALVMGFIAIALPPWAFGVASLAAAVVVVVGLVLAWRDRFPWTEGRVVPPERLLLVGTGPSMLGLARELLKRPAVEIVGFVDPDPARVGQPLLNPGVIGTPEDIPSLVERYQVDRVVVSLSEARGRLPIDRLVEARVKGVKFDDLADAYEKYTGKIAIENLRPSWLVFSGGFRTHLALRVAKRTVDVLAALAGLMLSAPLWPLLALGIRLSSPGPALFHQVRVGQHGRHFVIHKFRSMRVNAEADTGPVWSRRGDPRVFPFGRFMRRTRLDELPQLWNVLRGDLSLVGPRPERPEFVAELTREIPFYGQRHSIKPGLTGWAQVCGPYASSVEDSVEKLQWDLFYVKNVSVALDLLIVLRTFQTVLLRRGS